MPLPRWIPGGARVVADGAAPGQWSADELERRVAAVASVLGTRAWRGPIGLYSDNSPQWIAVDLAAHLANVTLVPLPGFFTPAQLEHVVSTTCMQALFCIDPRPAASLGFNREVAGTNGLRLFELDIRGTGAPPEPRGEQVQKITFTSGSTGTPKGVCLTAAQQIRCAQALAQLIAPLGITRHLNLLPLSVLLENVAGVYAPLLIDATCVCPSLGEVGLLGASAFDPERCLDAIARHAAESVIMLPQMLRALLAQLDRLRPIDPRLRSLKFVAVGGAKTPASLIERARELGLPVYEGYGLSECASVVTLNVPAADRIGSVGRALPGTLVRLADDGEIEVSGRGFAGYLGAPDTAAGLWLKTGDLGSIDSDGYISIAGRKGNLLITSYGRNVSPEWPESLLLASPCVAQAAVFGEGRPYLIALLVPSAAQVTDAALDAAASEANRQLPDYARIGAWLRAPESFTPDNGLATANGRVRRAAVWARYRAPLNLLYATESECP